MNIYQMNMKRQTIYLINIKKSFIKIVQIKIFNKKEQFVPVEYRFLEDWMGFLETEQKGCTPVYLYLQKGINRDAENENYGKSWYTKKRIAQKCGVSRPTLNEILDVLDEKELDKSLVQEILLDYIIANRLYKKRLEELIKKLKNLDSF